MSDCDLPPLQSELPYPEPGSNQLYSCLEIAYLRYVADYHWCEVAPNYTCEERINCINSAWARYLENRDTCISTHSSQD